MGGEHFIAIERNVHANQEGARVPVAKCKRGVFVSGGREDQGQANIARR